MNQPENTARCQQDMSQTPTRQNQMNKAFHNFTNIPLNNLWVWPRYHHEKNSSLFIRRLKTIPATPTRIRITAQEKSTAKIEERAQDLKNLLRSSLAPAEPEADKEYMRKNENGPSTAADEENHCRDHPHEEKLERDWTGTCRQGKHVGENQHRSVTSDEQKIELGNSDLLGKQPYRDRAEKTEELKLEQKASRHTCTRVE
jgi:hypothetical protein